MCHTGREIFEEFDEAAYRKLCSDCSKRVDERSIREGYPALEPEDLCMACKVRVEQVVRNF